MPREKVKALAMPAGVTEAIAYADAVLAGDVPVCKQVVLACERFRRDLTEANAGRGPWEFRPDLAEAAVLFAAELPNIKGPEGGKPLRLMGWQRFIFANLFEFVERGTATRRFRQGVVFVPKGNGKTTIAAPIALYLTFADDEAGTDGYAAAVTRDQARILFETAQNMVRRSTEFLQQAVGIQASAHAIYQESSASRLVPISSDALDGLNVQVAVCDEIASHRTSEVYDTLLTAMGKRRHPMLLSISTATSNTTGIGRQLWDYGSRVLNGAQKDDRLFVLIYTADDGDDPWEEATWRKCNPSWGQAVQPDAVRAIMWQARNNPAQEAAVKTRHLNVWVGADDALFSLRSWRQCANPQLELADHEGMECVLAIDLASKRDLAALVITFHTIDANGRRQYNTFARCYLNEAAVMEARNPSFPGWAAEGYLTITPGNETDFGTIEADVLDLCKRFRVTRVSYDPWAATQFAQRLQVEGVPVQEYRAKTENFSEPTKELDAAITAGRIMHDGNPVLEWCMGNVVGHYDPRGNVYPRKARPENKIDAAVALIMTIGTCEQKPVFVSKYETEPLFFIDMSPRSGLG